MHKGILQAFVILVLASGNKDLGVFFFFFFLSSILSQDFLQLI